MLREADLVILDMTGANPNTAFEAGYAQSAGKPVILLNALEGPLATATIAGLRHLRFTTHDADGYFTKVLDAAIADALNPTTSSVDTQGPGENSVFISYSHLDALYLNRLLVHLRPLEREGFLNLWVDTQLMAGDQWRDEIEQALTRARVAVLLVSPDFLASEFIVNHELPRLLQQAQVGGTRIVPVILQPCRFTRDRMLRVFQAINDPARPMSALTEGEREAVYDKVASTVEHVLGYED